MTGCFSMFFVFFCFLSNILFSTRYNHKQIIACGLQIYIILIFENKNKKKT